MPGPHAGEGEQLGRLAALVDRAVGVAAVGRGDDRGIIGNALRQNAGGKKARGKTAQRDAAQPPPANGT